MWLENSSTKNAIGGPPAGTPNRLLYIDPLLNRTPTPTPANPVAHIEYAYASVTHDNSHVIPDVYQRSSAGGQSTVVHFAVGKYHVRLANLGSVVPGPNGQGGLPHVTANGGGANWCRLQTWYPDGLDQSVIVHCFNGSGAAANEPFTVAFSKRTSPLHAKFGYALVDLGPVVRANWSHNSSQQPIDVWRNSTGRYSVAFRGLASPRGFAIATAQDQAICQVETWWILVGVDEQVDLLCMNVQGTPVDSRFTVTFTDTYSLLGTAALKRAALYAGSPTTPSYEPWWAYNSTGGTLHINRTGTGQYTVFLPAAGGTDEGSAQVNANTWPGPNATRCKTVPEPLLNQLYVRCHDRTGALRDSTFTLLWATHL